MSREVMQQALDALICCTSTTSRTTLINAIEALKAELAKPEPEPIYWVGSNGGAMPDEIYQDWSKAYPEDAKYFSPLYRKEDL